MRYLGLLLIVSCSYDFSALQPIAADGGADSQAGDRQAENKSLDGADAVPTPDAGGDLSTETGSSDATPVDTIGPETLACNEVTNEGCSSLTKCVVGWDAVVAMSCAGLCYPGSLYTLKEGDYCADTDTDHTRHTKCGIGLSCGLVGIGDPRNATCLKNCRTDSDCTAPKKCSTKPIGYSAKCPTLLVCG